MATTLLTELLPSVGDVISDRYELREEIGRGAFGVVWKANQIGIDEPVTIKILLPHVVTKEEMVKRFEREVATAKVLRHPNTVRAIDLGRTSRGLPFFVMEYVAGETLRSVLRRTGPLSPWRARRIALQVLKSLGEAHSRNIVHRDLKPSNLMLCDIFGEHDFVKVLDFGLAKAIEDDSSGVETHTGMVLGTYAYMSPEQIKGKRSLDNRSDLYSVGLLLAECVLGGRLIRANTLYDTIGWHATHGEVELERTLGESPLWPVICKALRQPRKDRYQDAQSMGAALEDLDIEKDSSTVSVQLSRHDEATPNTLIATPEPMMFPGEYKAESSGQVRGDTDTSSQTKVTGFPQDRPSSGPGDPDAGSSKSTRVAPRKPRGEPREDRPVARRLTPSGATNVITARSKRGKRQKVRAITREASSVLSSVVLPKNRTGWIALLLLFGTVGLGSAYGLGWFGGGGQDSTSEQAATAPQVEEDSAPAAEETANPAPLPVVNPEEELLATTHALQLAQAVVNDAVPRTHSIRIGGTPDMTVSYGDREIGETPFDLVLPSVQASVQLTFARRGYASVEQEIAFDQDEVSVVLQRRTRRDGNQRRGDRPSESGDQNSQSDEQTPEEPPALPFGRVGVEGGG